MTDVRRFEAAAARTCVVTGAARGLGSAVAAALVQRGQYVVAVDASEAVFDAAAQLGSCCVPVMIDLARPNCGDLLTLPAEWPPWSLLVNNAAESLHRPFVATTVDEFDRLVATNQRGPFLLTQRFARHVAAETPRDPLVVNISSVNATSGNPNLVAYAGTKGALEAMTRALAVELAPLGIRVNAIRPGAVDSPALRDNFANGMLDETSYWPQFLIPKPSLPEDIAQLVLFIESEAARTVTGAVWPIDGGYGAR